MTSALTDLEVRLAAPDGAATRDELMRRCDQLEQRLRARIAQGLSRDEFPLWQAAAEAAAAAHAVLAAWPASDASTPAVSASDLFVSSPH